mmetsp:Transcript_21548/g.50209  ORF Transcript_21548/g.50209 Transcript_21548/m.50209 type:complete len:359 (-) Transcript_21548:53-1129(-)
MARRCSFVPEATEQFGAGKEWNAFATPELFPYMEVCVSELRGEILNEMIKDPVPQFERSQIQENTKWLKAALEEMNKLVGGFEDQCITDALSDLELEWRLKAARESSRVIGTYLGGERSKFKGVRDGNGLPLQVAEQGDYVRTKLYEMKTFFLTFGCEPWLGPLATGDYHSKQKSVLAMLDALLKPNKALKALPLVRPSATEQPLPAASEPEQSRRLKKEFDRRGNMTTEQKLELLVRTAELVTESLKAEQVRTSKVKADVAGKMEDLKDCAETLSKMPSVLKKYLLTRLGQIKVETKVLQQWVCVEELQEVHSMLEAFRDAAIQERAERKIEAKMRRASLVSTTTTSSVSATTTDLL